jgi:hypothetical protein
MKNANSPNVRNRETKLSPCRSSRPSDHGFSRPASPCGIPRPSKFRAGASAGPFAPNPAWVFLELCALALDHDRARLYLAKPGCNVVLGMAHLARTMAKRSRILRFLRDDRGPTGRLVAFRPWAIGTPGAFLDRAEHSPEGSPAKSQGRSRRGTALLSRGDE